LKNRLAFRDAATLAIGGGSGLAWFAPNSAATATMAVAGTFVVAATGF
jgi:hypothetical protein